MRLLKLMLPPFFVLVLKKLRSLAAHGNGSNNQPLFDGDDSLFKRVIMTSRVYGEYGVGQSTSWVFSHCTCRMLSVDSSQEWIEKVLRGKDPSNRLSIKWIDIGPLGAWGKPIDFSKRGNFIHYVTSIWERDAKPDLVLIDGRFRVCCFAYSCLEAAPGTSIVFDDYTDRPHYHVVEELMKPTEVCGRQALFVVPDNLDRDKARNLSERFLYVID